MRLTSKAAAAVLVMCLGGPVAANSEPALTFKQGQDLAKQMACLGCHQVKAKRVGQASLRLPSAMLDNLRHLNT